LPAYAERVALLVGNASYSNGLTQLSNPPNDVKLLENTLKGLNFNVVTISNANQRDLQRAIRDFGDKAHGAELAFFYYSGHGMQSKGENYLIPIGAQIAKESDIEIESISTSSLLRQLEDAAPSAAVVVLDACRDVPQGFSKSASKGLVRMNAPSGTLIAYATAAGATASDDGYYARYLAQNLARPGMELKEIFNETAIAVEKASAGKQRPREDVGLRSKIYLINPTINITNNIAGGADPASIELQSWQAAQSGDSVESYQAYLDEYPKGVYGAPARIKLAKLKADLRKVPGATNAVAANTAGNSNVNKDPESALWDEIKASSSADEYDVYLKQYPKGKFVALAKQRLQKLRDEAKQQAELAEQTAWQNVERTPTVAGYTAYLTNYPNGKFAGLALARANKLKNDALAQEEDRQWQAAETASTEVAYQNYQKNYPVGRYLSLLPERLVKVRAEAKQREDDNAWKQAQASATRTAMQNYMKLFPEGRYFQQAKQKDEEYQRIPARPQLPFTVEENLWQTIESAAMYRNAPRAHAIEVKSAYQNKTEYTGAKSQSLPSPAPTNFETENNLPLSMSAVVSINRVCL